MSGADDATVRERIDVFPYTTPARTIRRNERYLLERAVPGPGAGGKLWVDVEAVQVVHCGATYEPHDFAPPRWIYQGDLGRIEWQSMDYRQPIYHRNLDVDEMSYQVTGKRTLMTEIGTTELNVGDFVRIPCGVCHDNWGRSDIHLLWYLPEPFTDEVEAVATSEAKIPPFEGWEPYVANELITDCLGASKKNHDVAANRSDEQLILEQVYEETDRLAVLRPPDPTPQTASTTLLWRGPTAQVAVVDLDREPGLVYTRHRNADEIQFQVSGTRMLITQHGCIELRPGDFTRIPIGVAATSITGGSSRHIATLSRHRLPRFDPTYTSAEWWDADQVGRYREKMLS